MRALDPTSPDFGRDLNLLFEELERRVLKLSSSQGIKKSYGDIDMQGLYKLINLAEPKNRKDSITKDYMQGNPAGLHAVTHQFSGSDQIDVTDLSGLLADLQNVLDHAHTSGGGGAGGQLDHATALTNLNWAAAGHTIDADVDFNSNKAIEISELQLDADCRVYFGAPANNNYFFFPRSLVPGSFM